MKKEAPGFPLTNYHAHTWRCMHADGDEESYVLKAIKNGFEVFGFADHTPWPYRSDFVASMRMRDYQLDDYVSTLRALREQYKNDIRIPIGLECEAFPEFYPWLRYLKESGKIDYFILGNHYDTTDEYHDNCYFGHISTPDMVERYVLTTVNGMQSGLFTYLAHPDLYLNDYPAFDETAESAAHCLCEQAQLLDMPLEYNMLGMNRNPGARRNHTIGYTSDEFWNIAAQYKIRAIIGIDAHAPFMIDCVDDYIRVRARLESAGIPVIDRLPL